MLGYDWIIIKNFLELLTDIPLVMIGGLVLIVLMIVPWRVERFCTTWQLFCPGHMPLNGG